MATQKQKLVSVIIPVYNNEKYVERCLNSVLMQTYNDLEIIVIDDGSTDGSALICQKLLETDDRIKYVYQENSGASAARNSGLSIAKGEYVAFVDSDDYIEPTYISKLVGTLESYNVDIVACGYFEVNKNYSIEHCPAGGSGNITDDLLMIIDYFRTPYLKLYSKTILDTYNIRFNEDMSVGEDQFFNLQYLKNTKKYCVLDEALYYYVNNENSLSHSTSIRNFNSDCKLLEEWKKFCKEKSIKNGEYVINDFCCYIIKKYIDVVDVKALKGVSSSIGACGSLKKENYIWAFLFKNNIFGFYKLWRKIQLR